MANLKVIATLVAMAGAEDAVRRLLIPAVGAFRAEPGCTAYVLLEDRQQAGRFFTFETWADEGALASHMHSPTMQVLMPKLKELLETQIKQEFLSALVEL
jgi:quinol monooxygenase YgiN